MTYKFLTGLLLNKWITKQNNVVGLEKLITRPEGRSGWVGIMIFPSAEKQSAAIKI